MKITRLNTSRIVDSLSLKHEWRRKVISLKSKHFKQVTYSLVLEFCGWTIYENICQVNY